MSSLYELVGEFNELYLMASDEELDAQVFQDTLEGLKGELEIKAEGYIAVINQLDMEVKACKEKADFFKNKATVRENAIKRMKSALCDAMIQTGHDDKAGLNAGPYTLKVANNGGVQPLEITGDVPDRFMKVVYETDTTAIRKALSDGEELEFAQLKPRGKHITIK